MILIKQDHTIADDAMHMPFAGNLFNLLINNKTLSQWRKSGQRHRIGKFCPTRQKIAVSGAGIGDNRPYNWVQDSKDTGQI